MRIEQLDYELPEELIAAHPAQPRDSARLMLADRAAERLHHAHVRDLPDLNILQPDDLLVVNETRVIPAAFQAERARTGGRVSGLYLQSIAADVWRLMLEARGRLQPGETILLDPGARLILEASEDAGRWRARLDADAPTEQILQRIGKAPLPPYIQRARQRLAQAGARDDDLQRYNTIYSRAAGSVAAPTAGLHFTPELFDRLYQQNIRFASLTLHVGPGTFTPVRTEQLAEHRMHGEWIHVPAATIDALRRTRAAGGRILVVGTTSVRALESLPDIHTHQGDYTATTELFIHTEAGFQFRFTDMLMTNFHLPRSTLLAMVAALPGVGIDRLKSWYAQAIARKYRFYSFGDAMVIV